MSIYKIKDFTEIPGISKRNAGFYLFSTLSKTSVYFSGYCPTCKLVATSNDAISNRAGKSPMGSSTEIEVHLVPFLSIDDGDDVFAFCFADLGAGLFCPNKGFIIFGYIPATESRQAYNYVYSSSFVTSKSVDSRLTSGFPKHLFYTVPTVGMNSGMASFRDKHKCFINIEPNGHTSLRIIVGYTFGGSPIYGNFGYDARIDDRFDFCVLSNENFSDLGIPSTNVFINSPESKHPRIVNTLNDITTLVPIDVYVNDRIDKFKYIFSLTGIRYANSYHYSEWYATKKDYPITGSKWFMIKLPEFEHKLYYNYIEDEEDLSNSFKNKLAKQWVGGTNYKLNTYVKNDGKLYICIKEHRSKEKFNEDISNWLEISALNDVYNGISVVDQEPIELSSVIYFTEELYINKLAQGETQKISYNCSHSVYDIYDGTYAYNFNCAYNNNTPNGSLVFTLYREIYFVLYGDNDNLHISVVKYDDIKDNLGSTFMLIDDKAYSMRIEVRVNSIYPIILEPVSYNCELFDIVSSSNGGGYNVICSIQ